MLKYETKRQPGTLGGSVFGYNDAYKRLHPFLKQWRLAQAAAACNKDPQILRDPECQDPASPCTQNPDSVDRKQDKLSDGSMAGAQQAEHGGPYIVSIDVSRAFDNIDAKKLLRLVEPLFQSQEYLIVKYAEASTLYCCNAC